MISYFFLCLCMGVVAVEVKSGAILMKPLNCSRAKYGQMSVAAARTVSEETKPSQIQFGPLPSKREYKSCGHRPPNFNPYYHVKQFMHIVYPAGLPTSLIQSALKEKETDVSIMVQFVETEIGFICVLLLSIALAMVVPGMALRLCTPPPSPEPPTCAPNCKKRTLIICLQPLLLILLIGCAGMIWSNEECSRGVASGPKFLRDLVEDVRDFFEDSTEEIKHLMRDSFEQAVAPASHDLNDAENLLGRPVQEELVVETGLDVALDSLVEIAAGAKDVFTQVAGILRIAVEAESLVAVTRSRLDELKTQLNTVKKHCFGPDRPLCDTIPPKFFEVKFSTKTITNSSQLAFLKQTGVESLSNSVLEANAVFTGLPSKIDKETKSERLSVASALNRRKSLLYKSAHTLERLKTGPSSDVEKIRKAATPYLDHLQRIEYWRWLVGLVAGILVMYVWFLLIGGACCGCCGGEQTSSPTLIVSLIILSIVSVCLWCLSLFVLFISGHGEAYVCRTLDEGGSYHSLTQLSPMVTETPEFQRSQLKTIFVNDTFDIGVMLRRCEDQESTYTTFKLSNVLDVQNEVNASNWAELEDLLSQITVNMFDVQIFTPKLNSKLIELQQGLAVNVSAFRAQLVGPVCSDLDTIATHLSSVSKQITDVSTAAHLEALAGRSRMMLNTLVKDLETHKENLMYHLTALELKMNPLLHQVNQSISHMKAVQYYITNHGTTIAQQKLKKYTQRIHNYLDQYGSFVHVALNSNMTSCHPIWTLFDSLRLFTCRQTLDPLNGFWFCTVFCLLLFIVITPLTMKLVQCYSAIKSSSSNVTTSQSFVAGDDSTWSVGPDNGDW